MCTNVCVFIDDIIDRCIKSLRKPPPTRDKSVSSATRNPRLYFSPMVPHMMISLQPMIPFSQIYFSPCVRCFSRTCCSVTSFPTRNSSRLSKNFAELSIGGYVEAFREVRHDSSTRPLVREHPKVPPGGIVKRPSRCCCWEGCERNGLAFVSYRFKKMILCVCSVLYVVCCDHISIYLDLMRRP